MKSLIFSTLREFVVLGYREIRKKENNLCIYHYYFNTNNIPNH